MIEKFSKEFDYSAIKRDVGWRRQTARERGQDARKLAENMTVISCPVCESNDANDLQQIYNMRYQRCNTCDLVYLAEIPNYQKLKSIYSDVEEALVKAPGDDLYNTDDFEKRVMMICQPKVEFVLDYTSVANPSWTDIGCGIGDLVVAANRAGCNAVGYDIDEREISHGIRHGANVERCDITALNASDLLGESDVISLISVLEHIPDCAALLQMLVDMTKVDAEFVIEVPRFNSLSSLVNINFPNLVSRHMLPPNHVMLFTDKSFEYLLNSAGLKAEATWFYGSDTNELLGNLFLADVGHNFEFENLVPFLNEFQSVIDRAKFCDEMLVVCKKK
jgi:2-polyprenyl-3-methyl-5-hydroxy-6-metoxy-1,4-benzoquinol methylase